MAPTPTIFSGGSRRCREWTPLDLISGAMNGHPFRDAGSRQCLSEEHQVFVLTPKREAVPAICTCWHTGAASAGSSGDVLGFLQSWSLWCRPEGTEEPPFFWGQRSSPKRVQSICVTHLAHGSSIGWAFVEVERIVTKEFVWFCCVRS